MELITKKQREKMIANGRLTVSAEEKAVETAREDCLVSLDHKPVVKLFTPDAGCTWLLTEMHPKNADFMFGLCDLGLGFPELGWVNLHELRSVRGACGLPVERDRHFVATQTIGDYAKEAREKRAITA